MLPATPSFHPPLLRDSGAPRCVLTIAGSDSGGGAGVQADSRAIRALGCFPLTAITAVTAQNTRGVVDWEPVSPRLIARQVAAVLDDMPVAAVKTGLLPGAEAVRAVARALDSRRLPLVVDPVVGSTSGTRFLDARGVRALADRLLPLASVVTPNRPELALLAGQPAGGDDEAEAAARRLCEDTGCAVLAKGGHATGPRCVDLLVQPGLPTLRVEGRRRRTRNLHGTGCSLASAIAAGLARGWTLPRAVQAARLLLDEGLRTGRRLAWGSGSGPALPL